MVHKVRPREKRLSLYLSFLSTEFSGWVDILVIGILTACIYWYDDGT